MSLEHAAPYLTPTIAFLCLAVARWLTGLLWSRFEAKMNEAQVFIVAYTADLKSSIALHNSEINLQLARIEKQTTDTNGRVGKLEQDVARLEGAAFHSAAPDAPT